MAREYFHAYHSYLDAMEPLNDAERGRLFTACLYYSKTGEEPELRGNERFVFPALRSQIDRDSKSYEGYCKQQAANGALGGRPKKPSGYSGKRKNPMVISESEKSLEKEKEKTKDISPPIIPPKRFAPPTTDEVRAYCSERGNRVDAQTFVDFYASKGWKVGNQPMKDWQAAVRTWEKREGKQGGKPAKRTSAHNHTTRQYTPDEIGRMGRDLLEEV